MLIAHGWLTARSARTLRGPPDQPQVRPPVPRRRRAARRTWWPAPWSSLPRRLPDGASARPVFSVSRESIQYILGQWPVALPRLLLAPSDEAQTQTRPVRQSRPEHKDLAEDPGFVQGATARDAISETQPGRSLGPWRGYAEIRRKLDMASWVTRCSKGQRAIGRQPPNLNAHCDHATDNRAGRRLSACQSCYATSPESG